MYFIAIRSIFLFAIWTSSCAKSMFDITSWKLLEYAFPSNRDRHHAIENGDYVPNSGTPIDVDAHYWHDGSMRIFVTVPRFDKGIPFTLATVTNRRGPKGPYIAAYPNYKWHSVHNTNCNGIISAFRVVIDQCNHMWVLDSGVEGETQICPPQLLTFDLNRDRLINRYQFTDDVYTPAGSLLITPAVDIADPPPRGRCQKAMVYIADTDNPGLVVYDSQQNVAWRIENDRMKPDPEWGTHTIAGESFFLMDGIFSVNLTPRGRGGERNLYFHALASDAENAVPLSVINNRANWVQNPEAMPGAFQTLGERGIQSAMEAIDSRGNMFANTHNSNIFVWNINTPYTNNSFRVVANNPRQLQFASGMKVKRDREGREVLWASTCRFQKISEGTLNPNETNFRILACRTDDLLSHRQCTFRTGPVTFP